MDKICTQCGISFVPADHPERAKFCSRSCAASFNNAAYPKRKKSNNKANTRKKVSRYDELIPLWLAGDNSVTLYAGEHKTTKPFVKSYLVELRGDACEQCGFDEKAPDGRSIIQMDHIDGNSQNNLIENLRLLCPNHHAMTSNYGSLNMGRGRTYRRSVKGSRTL